MIIETSLLSITLVILIYYYLILNHDYWKSREVAGPKPVPFFGTIKDVITQKYSMADYLLKIYKIYNNEPYVGIFMLQTPILVLHDFDIIRNVLIRDFENFADRGIPINEKIEPLTANLLNLEPERWRPLRRKLSPVFTSGKLKKMFHLLNECANDLVKYLETKIDPAMGNETTIECHDFAARFTTEVIGIFAFGLETKAMTSEESIFRKMGKRSFDTDWKTVMKFRLRILLPRVFDLMGLLVRDKEMDDFFIDTMLKTMNYRKNNSISRDDFIDLLMDIKDHSDEITEFGVTDSLLAAQLFVFFAGGFETASTTMSNALYELAINISIQEKLRDEINKEIERTDGVVEFEGIKKMKYLDMVFNETLRKYAPGPLLVRKSLQDYTIESSSTKKKLTIKKDQRIFIPIYAIQRDPNYFPEPEVFDPERFNDEAIKLRHPMVYMPFGNGPRNCIGKRFGAMQTKVGLVKILHRYRFEVCEKTQIPYVNDPRAILLAPQNGIYLKIVKLNSNNN